MLILRLKFRFIWLTTLLAMSTQSFATIEIPDIIGDGAVLQRDQPVPIWGTADPNAVVTVTLADSSQQAVADPNGRWHVEIGPHAAGGPFTLTASTAQASQTVSDLYFGDVWVASGQSNMEYTLRDIGAELATADSPRIRQFKVPRAWAAAPAESLGEGQWRSATQPHRGGFSAVAFYFAKRIQTEIGVPIGVLNASWGGSAIEAWMSPQALGKSPRQTQQAIEQIESRYEQTVAVLKKTLQRWPGALVERLDLKQIKSARADWSAANLDTSDWLTVEAPALWEAQGFIGIDGVMWYRKTFSLSPAEAGTDLTLGLGRIDDSDTTWVNGHRVGGLDAYAAVRRYLVPARYLQPGPNTIAVRVEDAGGGGGIYSSPDLLYLELNKDEQRRSLAGTWQLKPERVAIGPASGMHHVDTALYNKMINPLYRLPVKGVIWYQGESNANTVAQAERYAQQFTALIQDWRQGWQQADLPFYWVQLANFNSGRNTEEGKPWAIVREAQTAALALSNTGQAITIDVGDPDDIHPRDKQTVGDRLARIALHKTYGQGKVHFRGPVFDAVKVSDDRLVVQFASQLPLATRNQADHVKGFEIGTGDGSFQAVLGSLEGSSLIIQTQIGGRVRELRYAWDDNPEDANLVDPAGLPAEPFRARINHNGAQEQPPSNPPDL